MTERQVITTRVDEYGEIYKRLHPPLETRFEEEVEQYWERNWGAATEVGKLRSVLVHKPGAEIEAIQEPLANWRYIEKPDLGDMQSDYGRLVKALKDHGVEVVERQPERGALPRLVKSIYTRDPSFTIMGGVIIGRMYDALRRGEELPTTRTYAEIGCPILHTINGSGTMEGGSVVWITPKHLSIGITPRGNEEGARQIKEVVNTIDPEVDVRFVEVDHPSGHLDVPLTMVNVKTAVVDSTRLPAWFPDYLRDEVGCEVIEKPPRTYVEGTVVLEPGKVLFDAGDTPEQERGLKLLRELELEVVPVDLGTLSFPCNSGTLHCLAMPLIRDPEPA